MPLLPYLVTNQRTVTVIFSLVFSLVIFFYLFLQVTYSFPAGGITNPIILFTLYITIVYGWKWGTTSGIALWLIGIVLFVALAPQQNDTVLISMSFVWIFLTNLFGWFILQHMKRQQEEIHKRDIYSSIAAHELKTPIAVLKLHVGMLKKSNPTEAEKEEQQIDYMTDLISRMMDYSKIVEGKYQLHYSHFYLSDILQAVIEQLKLLHPGREIAFAEKGKKIPIIADKYAVEQIIINLLNNALKYGKNKPVNLTVVRHKQMIELQVKDGGDGIPIQFQKNLFSAFSQADSSKPGLGVGLYLVKQLIELHHGKISFKTGKQGTVFFTYLPIKQNIPS